MLGRLILALLLAAFALPAMSAAPCHGESTMMAGMTMPTSVPPAAPNDDRKAVMTHACLGCIPPHTLLRASLPEFLPREMPQRIKKAQRFDMTRGGPPATPPPRPNA